MILGCADDRGLFVNRFGGDSVHHLERIWLRFFGIYGIQYLSVEISFESDRQLDSSGTVMMSERFLSLFRTSKSQHLELPTLYE